MIFRPILIFDFVGTRIYLVRNLYCAYSTIFDDLFPPRPENSIFFFPTRTYNAANVAPHYIVFGAKGQFLPSIQGASNSSTAGPNAMMTRAEFEFIYGEARELFVVDGAFIKYAGLYRLKSMAHIAPNGVGLFEPWDRLVCLLHCLSVLDS